MTTMDAVFHAGDREATLLRLRRIARLMDTAFRIPGTRIRFGADPLLGLGPGGGDIVSLGIGLYAFAEAVRLGVPKSVMARMLANIAIDTGVGAIPLAGDIFDLFFKSNTRNLKLLLDHLESERRI